ncbi:MAG: hypothetical protein MJ245_02375 [Clostridia bacterium]|nr:hypothetical protein [Clostridia bacterium]
MKRLNLKRIGCLVLTLMFMFLVNVKVNAADYPMFTDYLNQQIYLGVNDYTEGQIDINCYNNIYKNCTISVIQGNVEAYYVSEETVTSMGNTRTKVHFKMRALPAMNTVWETVTLRYTLEYVDGTETKTCTHDETVQARILDSDHRYDPAEHDGYSEENYDPSSQGGDASGVYGDPDTLVQILNPNTGVGAVVFDFAKLVAAILTFISVIFIGVNIIMARGNGEQRSSTMQGLMYVAIGVIILTVVLYIYSMLAGLMGDPEADIDDLNVNITAGEGE